MKLSKIFNRQLALPLNFRKLKNQDNFLINDSNKMAVSLIDEMKNLSVFKKKYIFPILYLYGPERSGKTHLASIFKENNNAKFINRIEEKDLLNAKNGCSYIIDNLEKNSNLDPKMLMHLINEVYSGNGSILLISNLPPSQIKFDIIDLKSRIKSFINVGIDLPNDEVLYSMLIKELDDRKIILSDNLCFYIIKRIPRNYKSILEFSKQLDRISLEIKDQIKLAHIRSLLDYINNKN